jgi:flagellar hook-associated protein 2
MAQITSSVGLISGLPTADIINELISLDAAPVSLLQTQIASANAQQQAYSTLETQINNIQQIGQTLALPTTFQNTTATSSDPNVLTATTSDGAAVGSYQIQVAQLVTTQQSISQGFADATTAPVGAGTITLEEGGGEATSETPLAQLNGGAGVPSGQFRITDGSGASAVIDTTNDITLDDVAKQINTAVGISVHATVTDQGLVLTDQSGKTTDTMSVQDLDGGSTAESLGISGDAVDGVLTGKTINYIGDNTSLSQLNDGNGVSTASAEQNDFTITTRNGTVINVSLNGSTSVGDVLNAINTAAGSNLTASINSAGTGIQLTDNTTGSGTLSIAADNNSPAAADLGLTQSPASGGTLSGQPLIAGLDSVLTSQLKGGSGIALGNITITDGAGHSTTVNLSNATSFSDIINTINSTAAANHVDVTAGLNSSQTGLELTDTSGGTGGLVVADDGSTTAADLGIAGTFSSGTVDGGNLQHQYVSDSTPLSTYNGGQGVALGQFQITNSEGDTATVDLTSGTFDTIGQVIQAINSKNIGVTASINANGNGILLTDTAGGPNKLTVTDLGGTAAADLNIAGTATGTTIDGGLQKTITVTSSDTLTTLQNKINQAGFGVTASIINDGSATDPYRLSLTAVNSGQAGSVVIDGGTTNLNVTNLVEGQDAAVFFGGGNGDQPLLITSNTNQLTNVINGATISLTGASSSPVTLNIAADPSNIVTQLQNFVSDFNTLIGQISADSSFDTTTNQGGILLGDATTQQIQSTLYNMVDSVVNGTGVYNTLADMGVTIGIDTNNLNNGAQLTFNQAAFQQAFATNPTDVQNLFTQATTGLGDVINSAMDSLTDPENGVITLENNTLTTQVQQYQDSINTLNDILAQKRQQLENQFADMESTLASLESQGAILSSLSSTTSKLASSTPAASSSSPSSSSSSGASSTSSGSSGSGSSS